MLFFGKKITAPTGSFYPKKTIAIATVQRTLSVGTESVYPFQNGHVVVTMLACMMAQSFQTAIAPLNLTATAAWDYVAQLQTVRLSIAHATRPPVKKIQTPTTTCAAIFAALTLKVPNLSFTPVV